MNEFATIKRPKAALAMHPHLPDRLFSRQVRHDLDAMLQLHPIPITQEIATDADLEELELLIGGWGCPLLDERTLSRMPQLRAVIYTAGSVKGFATDELFRRGIAVTSGVDFNALPVAEYTLAAILMSGKRVFELAGVYRTTKQFRPFEEEPDYWGNYGLKVGIVGASRIGRRVIELLAPFDVDPVFYDPFVTHEIVGARPVTLDKLLRTSDVVSLHAPAIPETFHMIDSAALSLMRSGTTLINTARGSLVDSDALLAELDSGRLNAVLDVTDPDPLPRHSPLFEAPNLLLTPHIAGSQGNELRRLGDAAFREVSRFVAERPLLGTVKPEILSYSA